MRMLQVHPLGRGQVDQVFPMLRIAAPALTLGEWRMRAARLWAARDITPTHEGALVAEAPNGTIRGMLIYSLDVRAGNGSTLVVRQLVTPVLGGSAVAAALWSEVRRMKHVRGGPFDRIEFPSGEIKHMLHNGAEGEADRITGTKRRHMKPVPIH